MSVSGRKLAKRACDPCKIRKIKCDSSTVPCNGCVKAGVSCTFVKQPSARGPRRLRKSTLREIEQSQQQWEDLGFGTAASEGPVVHTKLDAESVFAPNKVAALVLQLCVYRLRTYAIWPIIKVERLVASLQKTEPDIEVFGLAYAVAAATIVQLRTKPSTQPGAVTAEMMEAQCQYAKVRRNKDQPPDLTTVRIPFFLHLYYENLEPGGLQSITYLREAIAIAHMIGLHRETYYSDVQPEEREIRRRTLWLLFVAERNVSICHKLPVTIRTKIAFPSTIDSDSEHVLSAYQKLVTMFWEFDRSGVFELLDRCDFDFAVATKRAPPPSLMAALTSMRKRLDDKPISVANMEDTQACDLLITRQWMRIILWRLTQTQSPSQNTIANNPENIRDPLKIAKELFAEIAHTPETAVEAHSSFFETKIFEIATSVADTVRGLSNHTEIDTAFADGVKEVLTRFRGFLSRNTNLTRKLQNHTYEIQQDKELHLSIANALSMAMEVHTSIADVPSVDSNTSFLPSESPGSSTGLISGSQASLSPSSHWHAQGFQGSLLGSPDPLASNRLSSQAQESFEQSYMDMDWSQYESIPEVEFPTSSSGVQWHDMNFMFEGR